MGLIDDPISGIVGLFFKRALDSKIGRRAELLLEMAIAGAISFLLACGLGLMTLPVAEAIGSGMLAAGIVLLATFQASPNSKGLTIAVRAADAGQENSQPTTTIERK